MSCHVILRGTGMTGAGVPKKFRSATFTVGGYDWAMDVFFEKGEADVLAFLELVSDDAKVLAFCDLRLVNQDTRSTESLSLYNETTPRVFRSADESRWAPEFVYPPFDASDYIKDDCLTVECQLTVIKESDVDETAAESEIQVPPSELSDHFGKLLAEKEGADVTFSTVGGETFAAHKIVLATRSPVFKAELCGSMMESRVPCPCVTVQDMQPDVFRALLHFVYTDSLPPGLDGLDGDDKCEMIRHLLVAADRYGMDRLKLICQNILAKNLDVETVATTLALADQHNCDRLKDVCVEFMASSDKMQAVVATKGYANLKRSCPSMLLDVFEKTTRIRKA